MVLHQHDDELDALLDRGHQLLGHHQVRAVADHDEDVPVRVRGVEHRHRRAQPPGDLVAHAGVAVLDVVALRVPGAPQLVQVARHRAGGADDDVPGRGDLVDHADHLGLRGQRAVAEVVRPLDRLVPLRGQLAGQSGDRPARSTTPPARRSARAAPPARRRRSATPACLAASEGGDVDVDEADRRVAEGGPGGGGEVAVAGADPEHHVGLAGDPVRRRWCRCCRARRARAGGRTAASPFPPGSRRPGCRSPRRRRAARRSPRRRPPRRRPRPAAAARTGARRPRGPARPAPAPAAARARRARRTAPTGQSYASACTSCGSATVTAPISAGSVSTRIAPSNAAGSCSGRQTRSKNRDSGRKASLTDTS